MTSLRVMFMGVMLAVVPGVASGQPASGPDWPQWRGPNRTGVSSEVGLLPEWPATGPPLTWSITTVGMGYGTVAVQDGRIFVQGSDGRQSVVVVVRVADGHTIWSKVIGPSGNNNRGPGPRGTPTVDSDRVYALTSRNGEVDAQEVYFTRDMQNHHGGVILRDGYLYGFHNSILTCLEFATGKVMWRDRSVGKGSLTYADGHLYLFSENNVVGLAETRPSDYLEKGRFEVADQGLPSWAHPVVSGGTLYIRNQDTLAAYDVLAR